MIEEGAMERLDAHGLLLCLNPIPLEADAGQQAKRINGKGMLPSMNGSTPTSGNIETFALELVRLIRDSAIYPGQHLSLQTTAAKVVASAPLDSTRSLTMGVTPAEVVLGGQFIGGKVARLASLLHTRKILLVFWTKDVKSEDVLLFARLLSTPKLEGAELRRKLHAEGVYSIDFEPLEIHEIHGKIEEPGREVVRNPNERRRQAWMLLMDRNTSTEEVASALAGEHFLEEAQTAWSDLGYGDSEGFTTLILNLGKRFEAALSLLPNQKRESILGHMAEMGKLLSPQDLARIVALEGPEGRGVGPGIASLFRKMDGPRFVDFLADLAASNNQGTRRLLEVYRALTPDTPSEELLALVRAKLSMAGDSGFAMEVWEKVETFILDLTEEAFMDTEYSKALEDVADSAVRIAPDKGTVEVREDPIEHLDHVILAAAGTGGKFWEKKLLERLETRMEQLDITRVLTLVRHIDDVLPGLLDRNSDLVRTLFRRGMVSLSKTKGAERQALFEFSLRHEEGLLDSALKALSEERQISVRHCLVDLLSQFSPAATPVLISRARHARWYLARNLTIVLGQQGLPQAIPALKSLSKHHHPKVRKEALKALRNVQRRTEIEDPAGLRRDENGSQSVGQEGLLATSLPLTVEGLSS
jgi:hypothetical protein